MALDAWQARAAMSRRKAHEEQIAAKAATAEEYARYLGRNAQAGQPPRFAGDLLTLAQGIAEHAAAIAAIDEILAIAAADGGS
jgi:hypothetical protein